MIPGNSKEEILRKVRQALGKGDYVLEVPELVSPVLNTFNESDLAIVFAENFVKTKGVFFFCENQEDFILNLKSYLNKNNLANVYAWEKAILDKLADSKISFHQTDDEFEKADVGISGCEVLVARTGSMIVSSANEAGRRLGIYPHVHVVVAYTSQIVKEISEGLAAIRKKYKNKIPSMVSLITGPSRTADIEKTLVLGAHGPRELVLFLIDDSTNN